MARTAAGRALTAQQKADQLRHASTVLVKARTSWLKYLDVSDLDASFPTWLLTMDSIVEEGFLGSERLAANYLARFAEAEGIQISGDPRAVFDRGEFTERMLVNGPISIKQKIAKGMDPNTAKGAALNRFLGAVQEQVLDGGRDFLIDASRYSGKSGRWRRVTDGKPCAFCAMLASRGPVYTERSVVFDSHVGCGCTAEIVVGEWEATQREKLWRHSYNMAGLSADNAGEKRLAPARKGKQGQDTILWRMRRNSPELFSDGVFPKAV